MSPGKDAASTKIAWLPTMGRALAHRNFRLFIFGQSISVVGTWMQQIATVWLVYRLSNSSFLLGLAGFSAQIPAALVLPVAGVLTDRWSRHHTVTAAQALSMVQAFALMALTLAGVVSVWHVMLLGALLGLVNAFDATARQSFVIQMVERQEDLANAIAINSSVFNAARLVGPAIAGVVIGMVGEWPCFLINGLSYLAVLASLLAMRVRPMPQPTVRLGIFEGFSEGFEYVTGSMPIRTLLILLGIVSMMSAPLTVLMPILATEVLHGGPGTLGLLTAALGVGAPDGKPVSGRPQERCRPEPRDCRGDGGVRPGDGWAFAFPHPLDFSCPAAGDGFCHGGADGRQQYHVANHCRREQAGAGDELLHDGLLRHGAVGKPAGRLSCQHARHGGHVSDLRHG